MTKIIALCGQAGHGKSTFADMLTEEVNTSQQLAFATPLRTFLLDCLGLESYSSGKYFQYTLDPVIKQLTLDEVFSHLRLGILGADKLKIAEAIESLQQFTKERLYTIESVNTVHEILRQEGITIRKALQLIGTEWARSIDPNIWTNITKAATEDSVRQGTDLVVITDCRFEEEVKMLITLGATIVSIHNPRITNTMDHASEQPLDDKYVDKVINNNGDLRDLRNQAEQLIQSQARRV